MCVVLLYILTAVVVVLLVIPYPRYTCGLINNAPHARHRCNFFSIVIGGRNGHAAYIIHSTRCSTTDCSTAADTPADALPLLLPRKAMGGNALRLS